jgi:hypothetical protein
MPISRLSSSSSDIMVSASGTSGTDEASAHELQRIAGQM